MDARKLSHGPIEGLQRLPQRGEGRRAASRFWAVIRVRNAIQRPPTPSTRTSTQKAEQ
jgi:hypothetical protein